MEGCQRCTSDTAVETTQGTLVTMGMGSGSEVALTVGTCRQPCWAESEYNLPQTQNHIKDQKTLMMQGLRPAFTRDAESVLT